MSDPTPKPTPKPGDSKSIPAKLLASVVRPAFRTLDIKNDRGQKTKAVESEPDDILTGSKTPGSAAKKPFDPAENVGFGPTAGRAGPRPVRRNLAKTRLDAASAAALRANADHVPEPHLHRHKSGGYIGLFLVIFICVAFGAYTFGYLPLDQLFDQGNAAVQSHNDQMVNFLIHKLGPILGIALGALIVITLLRNAFASKQIE